MTHPSNPPRMIEADRSTGTPRIYVACLAAYNNAMLHGVWVSAAEGVSHIQDAVREMLSCSPITGAEEWAIHDYEYFGTVSLSEHASFARVCEIAQFIGEHEAFGAALLTHFGGDIADASTALENYVGEYESLSAFAEELTAQAQTDIPETLARYIDYDAMSRDLELGGDVFTLETGHRCIHIFWSH